MHHYLRGVYLRGFHGVLESGLIIALRGGFWNPDPKMDDFISRNTCVHKELRRRAEMAIRQTPAPESPNRRRPAPI